MKNWFKSFVHNCVIHPLLPFLPEAFGDKLHDINGCWAYNIEPIEK